MSQYSWDMQLIATAWAAGETGQIQELLDRQRPAPGDKKDLRGFEWQYWDRKIHAERRRLTLDLKLGTQELVSPDSWSVSNDGARLACITKPRQTISGPWGDPGGDVQCKIFDTGSGKLIRTHPVYTHQTGPSIVVAAPLFSCDGQQLALGWAAGGRGGPVQRHVVDRVQVVDVTTGKVIFGPQVSGETVTAYDFSPDGRRFVTVAFPTPIQKGGWSSGPPLTSRAIRACKATVWDLTATPVKDFCTIDCVHPTSEVACVAFSPDGKRLAGQKSVRGPDGGPPRASHIAVWDSGTGKELANWPNVLAVPVVLAFSPNGNVLAGSGIPAPPRSSGYDLNDPFKIVLAVWDVETGTERFTRRISGATGTSLTRSCVPFFSPDGSKVGVQQVETSVQHQATPFALWDLATGEPAFDAPGATTRRIQFTPDSKKLLTSDANTLFLRDAETGRAVSAFRGHLEQVVAASLSSDGRRIVSLDRGDALKEWDVEPAEELRDPERPHRPPTRERHALSRRKIPRGLGPVGRPKRALARPLGSGHPNPPLAAGPARPPGRVPHSRALAPTSVHPGRSIPCHVPAGPVSRLLFIPKAGAHHSTAIGRDGLGHCNTKRSRASQVAICRPVGGDRSGRSTSHGVCGRNSDAATPDGMTSTFQADGTPAALRLYDVTTGRVHWSQDGTLELGTSGLEIATFSPDGGRFALARGGAPGNSDPVKLLVLDANTGQELATATVEEWGLPQLIWSPDGSQLALGGTRNRATPAGVQSGGEGTATSLLRIYDSVTLKKHLIISHHAVRGSIPLTNAVFSPDGRRVAIRISSHGADISGRDDVVKLFDSSTGKELLCANLATHAAALRESRLAFTANGDKLLLALPGPPRTADRIAGGAGFAAGSGHDRDSQSVRRHPAAGAEEVTPVTRLLDAANRGDRQAAAELLPLVYDELRKLAAARMAQEKPGQTLDATALVHEAYLRLVGDQQFDGRGHFFAAAAEAMRRILVENARRKGREKRGGGRVRVDLDRIDLAAEAPEDLLALDEALTRLAAEDAVVAAVVNLRYFAGLTIEETAAQPRRLGPHGQPALGVRPRLAVRPPRRAARRGREIISHFPWHTSATDGALGSEPVPPRAPEAPT